jgi:hypothetical protein
MHLSRRAFVGSVAVAPWPRRSGGATIVDLGAGCLLRESLAGYRTAIAEGGINRADVAQPLLPAAIALLRSHRAEPGMAAKVVPGAAMSNWTAPGPALLECALGVVRQPASRSGAPYVPYVDFNWPIRAKIREFFPLVLQPRQGDAVIATYAGAPVALRRGSLIVLGSPIGPALAAGDPDARRWLASVLKWLASRGLRGV